MTLGHTETDHTTYLTHRGLWETEAESVAYVLAGLLGLDTTEYSIGYIAGWADADVELIRSTATRVLAAVHTLAAALIDIPQEPPRPDGPAYSSPGRAYR